MKESIMKNGKQPRARKIIQTNMIRACPREVTVELVKRRSC